MIWDAICFYYVMTKGLYKDLEATREELKAMQENLDRKDILSDYRDWMKEYEYTVKIRTNFDLNE